MNREHLAKQLFKSVVAQYDDIKDKGDFQYKVKHSSRVARNAVELAKAEGLDVELSYIIGLLHDIGRFEQTRMCLGFDGRADDVLEHGDFGAKLIEEDEEFKANFTDQEFKVIVKAVKNHNKFAIEEGLDEFTLTYCKMIRDADKDDILYMLAQRDYADSDVSDKIVEQYNSGSQTLKKDIQTKQDELISVISFRFDIYFESTKIKVAPYFKTLESKCTHIDKLKQF